MKSQRKQKQMCIRTGTVILAAALCLCLGGCAGFSEKASESFGAAEEAGETSESPGAAEEGKMTAGQNNSESGGADVSADEEKDESDLADSEEETTAEPEAGITTEPEAGTTAEPEAGTTAEPEAGTGIYTLSWDPTWPFAEFSQIHSGTVTRYPADEAVRNGITIAVNAGHGTSGGESVRTQCHPDGSPKVTGGSTGKGETTATAVSVGTTFLDGTPEADATLALAMLVKEDLLAAGFDVLMIRESDDVQLDNIARTVFANRYANAHISLHYDSTTSDKGAFYMSVPDVDGYRQMEPVASNWEYHNALGEALIDGLSRSGISIYGNGSMPIDLTQTSYSTIPSVDIEVGDRASDHSEEMQSRIAEGITTGVCLLFGDGMEEAP